MKEAKVLQVSLDRLIEDPENPNKMSKEDFDLLCASVAQNGMLQPILVKEPDQGGKDYPIADGHHRARAARKAGHKTILAVVWDGTEEMRRAIAISMNKLRGELDLSAVQKVITDLFEDGWSAKDLTVTGYNEEEINELLKLSQEATAEDILENPIAPIDESEDAPVEDRPLVLELTFATAAELKRAKRGLKRAAGKGRELGEGLLRLLEGAEE